MKRRVLFMLFMLVALGSYSQDPWNPTRTYCEIVGTGNLTGTKVKVEIDFGQAQKYWSKHSDNFLVDADGKEIKFNSMVDALNYMAQFGWKFEQAYVITENSAMSKNVYHYLLSKELRGGENVNSGIYIKKDHENEHPKDEESHEKPTKKKRKVSDDIY